MPIKDFVKKWEIIQMDQWEVEHGWFIEFFTKGKGQLHFICVDAEIDYRYSQENKNRIEFTFYGNDECEETFGRGWAEVKGVKLHGYLCFHNGDDSEFEAKAINAPN